MVELLAVVLAVLRAVLRSRTDLLAANLLLRLQLAVLTRPIREHRKVRVRDELLWVIACRVCRDWRRHLVLVRPDWSSAGTAAAGASSGAGAPAARSAVPG